MQQKNRLLRDALVLFTLLESESQSGVVDARILALKDRIARNLKVPHVSGVAA